MAPAASAANGSPPSAAGGAVESAGACATVCDRYEDGVGFSDCRAGGVRYAEVVNAHLRSNAMLGTCGLR